MKVAQLLSIYPELRWGEAAQKEVGKICADSREFASADVFVAIRGLNYDGHQFVPTACQKGASAVVVEQAQDVPGDFRGAVVVVKNTRVALNQLASRFFGDPGQRLFSVGVTGTNGKTTIVHMVEAIFTAAGWPTGVMGTIDHHLAHHCWKSELTTPGPLVLHRRLKEFLTLGAKALATEISSHALAQRRGDSIPFDVAIFSNLSRDHLDYHSSLEEYFAAKQRLFTEVLGHSTKENLYAIINTDDSWGRQLNMTSRAAIWSYGQDEADFQFTVRKSDLHGTQIDLQSPRGATQFFLPMVGIYNAYNAVAAIASGMAAGFSLDVGARAMEKFSGVKGRLERVDNDKGIHVFVDYAHTPDALKSVLSTLAQAKKTGDGGRHRLITVFGCGGDKDRGKRPLMGQVAEEKSDIVFVTSDNPRREEPQVIIEEILGGMSQEPLNDALFVEVDRRQAIRRALRMAGVGDVVLIAGKGHEEFQIIGDGKIPMSDVKTAREVLDHEM